MASVDDEPVHSLVQVRSLVQQGRPEEWLVGCVEILRLVVFLNVGHHENLGKQE